MKGLAKNNTLIASLSRRLGRIHRNNIAGIKDSLSNRRTITKVRARLDEWVSNGMHLECYDSMDEILDELGLTNEELSFYCARVLKKKFLTWRKELRINEAKKLLLEHPDAPASHIGFAVGLFDKSNFRQQFKALVGCTPTEWREMHLKNHPESHPVPED